MKNFITKNENGTNVLNNDRVYDTVRALMETYNLYSINFANEEEATYETENNRLFVSINSLKKEILKIDIEDYEEYMGDEIENHMESLSNLNKIIDYSLNNNIEDVMVINKNSNWYV